MTTATLDRARVDAFAQRLAGVLNGAALTLMLSVGHRTGLFEVMRGLPPATCAEIAGRAGLAERYVREWLGAMLTGGVVEAAGDRFRLPGEHAACLTSAGRNFAITAQFIPELAAVEDLIVRCFARGGGVSHARYPRFREVMTEDGAQTVVAALEERILPIVPGLVDRLAAGIDVLDVGCGRAIHRMAGLFPRSRFVGMDISEEATAGAQAQAHRLGLANVRFEARDCAGLADAQRYDLVTAFGTIHDQVQPAAVLASIRRALRPGGVFLMQDVRCSSHMHNNVDHPFAPLIYTISCMHCMPVSLAAGGPGLGAAWGEENAQQMLGAAGFDVVARHHLPHDVLNTYFVCVCK